MTLGTGRANWEQDELSNGVVDKGKIVRRCEAAFPKECPLAPRQEPPPGAGTFMAHNAAASAPPILSNCQSKSRDRSVLRQAASATCSFGELKSSSSQSQWSRRTGTASLPRFRQMPSSGKAEFRRLSRLGARQSDWGTSAIQRERFQQDGCQGGANRQLVGLYS